ncbi:hypothetical protein [Thalassobacillus pellis]|uniref:hypothetical protein n=1 Tax=Thalassobacillus pellis TaxID=748008 RepID=UPI00195F5FC1|nr:hypothetical protein [Thalassobacillus pellis]MBM7554796.1 hypothetical protein [Thalassobacillus pellis]
MARQYKYDLHRVKQLLRDTNKSYRKIEKETKCPYSTVVYHGRRIRGKRYNRSVAEEQQLEIKKPTLPDISEEPARVNEQENPLFHITRENVSLDESEKAAAKMIQAAKVLGAKQVTIQVKDKEGEHK